MSNFTATKTLANIQFVSARNADDAQAMLAETAQDIAWKLEGCDISFVVAEVEPFSNEVSRYLLNDEFDSPESVKGVSATVTFVVSAASCEVANSAVVKVAHFIAKNV